MFKMTSKYAATIMGTVIAIICFASTWTYIVPMLTIIPIGLPLELVFGKIFETSSYAATSTGVLLTLIALFLIVGLWFVKQIEKDKREQQNFNSIRLIFFFAAQLVIIHPLVFYFWATMNSQNAGDGQFMFGMVETFPISSVLFAILGLTIDRIKNKKTFANST